MDLHDFNTMRKETPFRPFRVLTKSGRTFDAVHPGLFLACTRYLIIGIPRKDSKKPIFETFTRVPYSEIAQVDRLEPAAALPLD